MTSSYEKKYESILQNISKNAMTLKTVKKSYVDSKIIELAINKNGISLKFMNYATKNNKEIVEKAISNNGKAIVYASFELQNDLDLAKKAIYSTPSAIKYIRKIPLKEIKNDKDIAYKCIQQNGLLIQYFSKEIKQDEQFAQMAVNQNVLAIKFIPLYMPFLYTPNADYIYRAAKKEPFTTISLFYDIYYYYRSTINKKTPHVCNKSIKVCSCQIYKKIFDDYQFIHDIGQINSSALSHASDRLKDDKKLISIIVNKNGIGLSDASDRLKKDTDVVFSAVNNNAYALKYADQLYWTNKILLTKYIKLAHDCIIFDNNTKCYYASWINCRDENTIKITIDEKIEYEFYDRLLDFDLHI